ncbi:MAG: citramalate synthase [Candidatus Brocadiaceae bacterium]|nr:citramalate synthase [Candidatus Brocadiaceae bacterium]
MGNGNKQVYAYDTTLRDGCQAEGVSLTVEQKLEVAQRLDELGIHFIEGGYPLSNPKDQEFFHRVRKLRLRNARVASFGSTRKAATTAAEDRGLRALLDAETEVVAIVAKAWDLHVEKVLRTTLDENLRMVEDSVRFLKDAGRTVILDAEHFFDGYRANPDHAMKVAEVAAEAGADCVVLCDTNGGTLTADVARRTAEVVERIACSVGIHCHNDSGLAVANSVAAVQSGAVQVQGTVNGLGERVGNADLCSIIAILNLKTDFRCITDEQLRKLTEVSRFVDEVANLIPNPYQPFVGKSAFAHKGGLHHDAMRKAEHSYEHIDPALVGNEQRFLLSELSGRASMLAKMQKSEITQDPAVVRQLLDRLQNLENEGYQFEAAEASFELVAQKAVGRFRPHFDVRAYHISVIRQSDGSVITDATVKLNVNGTPMHTAAEGNGPVNALDGALRKALEPHYPALKDMHLTDYSVRVINPKAATQARVRVVIQSADDRRIWGTVGVSENIIEASWQALIDSFEYRLLMEE